MAKTLDSKSKAAWVAACQKEGVNFTPTMESLAAEAAAVPGITIDWSTVLADLKTGLQWALTIIGLFSGGTTPKMACKLGCCDNCKCSKEEITLCAKLLNKLVVDHCCCCDDVPC
jgi:hypothetical protein